RFHDEFREERDLSSKASSADLVDKLKAARIIREFYGDPVIWRAGGRPHFPADSRGGQLEAVVRGLIDNRVQLNGFLKIVEGLKRALARQRRIIESNYVSFLESIDSIDQIEIDAQ